MDFSPNAERWLLENNREDRAEFIVEKLPNMQWAHGRAIETQRTGLQKEKHDNAAKEADWHRKESQSNVVIDDRQNAVPASLMSGPSLRELERIQRRTSKILDALQKLERDAKIPVGRTGWMVKGEEVKALIFKLAAKGDPAKLYALKGKPSRKGMNDAGKVADAGHARRKQLVEAYPDRATAEAMVRGLLRFEESPLRLSLNPYHMSRQLNLPLVSMKWGPGRSEPLPEDVAAMFHFLATERIEDDLMEQLDRRYTGFKADGVLTLTEPERRRELAIVDEAIHAAELEEAAHLIGLIETEGTLILPPARMGAKALLGLL